MDQISRKNKLKSCLENLKGQTWKSRKREKRKEKIKRKGCHRQIKNQYATHVI
jgi:hypothetical protein